MPVITTTTPVITTTTMPIFTTTTTPVITTTTTPIFTTTTATEERRLSFTMDISFDNSFNDPTHSLYQNTLNAIRNKSQEFISTYKEVRINRFESGSTICDYTITATSFQESEIRAVKAGVFRELSKKYPVRFNSQESLRFNPDPVVFRNPVTVRCGPPPENLNFGTEWEAKWRLNSIEIPTDELHKFSKDSGASVLTVSKFFSTDKGRYECTLKRRDNSIFRQSHEIRNTFNPPLIEVKPVSITVQCEAGKEQLLQCSVNSPYEVEFKGLSTTETGSEITHPFIMSASDCENGQKTFTCQAKNHETFNKTITLQLFRGTDFLCNDDTFGVGNRGDKATIPCEEEEGEEGKEGNITAECLQNRTWGNKQKNCILRQVQELLEQSQFLNNNSLPVFLDQLSNVTVNFTNEVVASPLDISAIVDILNNVANASLAIPINETLMEDVLLTVGILTSSGSRDSWNSLNANDTRNISETSSPTARSVSSTLLQSVEDITKALTNDSFNIDTPFILLNKTTFTDTFNADIEILDSAVETDIPESDGENKSITVITFASMENVLPARDENNSTSNFINGRVVLVYSDGTVNNVSFTFDILNDTLKKPQCVFWNFSLFDGLGGWDDEGCELVDDNNTVTCNCNHLTSFSMLMSPFSPNDPVLEFITYIGVGISMASLVICLIIEAVIWRKIRKNNTSYLRHVSIVNIAVSLLIANIWFIIGAAISEAEKKDRSACSAATFFIHLFYLALFFWMFASALLLLYRTVSVFEGLSKNSMLAIGFSLGYGAPLIIAIITIAVTAPNKEYIRETPTQLICWLNFDDSKPLLAFVIPALLIVVINLIILCVVIYKMLRRRAVGDAAQAAERNVLVVIIRSLAVLTPIFGLTWSLGVGTMTNPHNKGIHGSFAFFNSLQGFFILVFGTLLDKKVRSEIAAISQSSGTGTRSTSAGTSSSSGLGFFRNWRRGRDGYNLSSTASGVSHSFTNT
ncbi:adhesion G-protein coupled receptor F1-like isoform X5 [Epinephelus fuscoguttatus]|uniref:adhesion G-protein coupled receptor F1-like isoform X1 n=2 Tax=Epinephelus fuscoguttatus TaxID=293821 RepID=UPI0020D0BE98|nr:adhesion G-protein coupled receptor F1-like isoform X1 [Epinephelus fuscoguttatus]XP_049446609.1 adhesion G-protein coupled receptor F1-like isoform X2 [Epinephelus fuscoguttatus]XP_049446610.1 adhesion G-protein coupled receptor F1-like isoform X3 [Epinephelus fuscoguttatus]XP_049446611.1 adhesion G-protein coupled receptor F1-like isoform X4 [Epinephelus fuscoguttatus]XP_049446612.1 adhesion G-protein coupled receptor F1-like isoform X5 [Epinephelus fuscoguttatus]